MISPAPPPPIHTPLPLQKNKTNKNNHRKICVLLLTVYTVTFDYSVIYLYLSLRKETLMMKHLLPVRHQDFALVISWLLVLPMVQWQPHLVQSGHRKALSTCHKYVHC